MAGRSRAPARAIRAFFDEIILTALLLFGVFAITEQYNEMAPGANSGALIIGFLVAVIGASMGYLEAWAINPARDLGPRLAHAVLPVAGKGESDWGYAPIPILGPLIGAAMGGLILRALGA